MACDISRLAEVEDKVDLLGMDSREDKANIKSLQDDIDYLKDEIKRLKRDTQSLNTKARRGKKTDGL